MRRAFAAIRFGLRLLPVVLLLLLAVPGSGVRPTTLSLTTIERAQGYDAGGNVVWVLVLGSDAPRNRDPNIGNTDAIQLVGINLRTGAAAGIGVLRDSWVEMPDGFDRINVALREFGPEVVAQEMNDLVGITPDFVLVTGGDGFLDMVETLGGVTVDSRLDFVADDDPELHITRGLNVLTPQQALDFATTRENLEEGGDIARSANHQALLLGLLKQLQAADDRPGFVETMALSAIDDIDTGDASALDLYRLVNALTAVDPERVSGCIVTGTPVVTEGGAQVIEPDLPLAQRLGEDVRRDATYDRGCDGR